MTTLEIILLIFVIILMILIILFSIFYFIKKNHNNIINSPLQENSKIDELLIHMKETKDDTRKNNEINIKLGEQINNLNNQLIIANNKIIELESKSSANFDNQAKILDSQKNDANTKLDDLLKSTAVVSDIFKNIENDIKKEIPIISKSVSKINDIFLKPKNRGNVGEFAVEKLLEDILGLDGYEKQKKIEGGTIDFYFEHNKYKIGIDAKFPLENYLNYEEQNTGVLKTKFKNDIENFCKDLKKYVNKGVDQVLVFVPSEGVYYTIIQLFGFELIEKYAKENIFLCSPTYFNLYLKVFSEFKHDSKMNEEIIEIKDKIKDFKDKIVDFSTHWKRHGDCIKKIAESYKSISNDSTKAIDRYTNIFKDEKKSLEQTKKTINEEKNEIQYISETDNTN